MICEQSIGKVLGNLNSVPLRMAIGVQMQNSHRQTLNAWKIHGSYRNFSCLRRLQLIRDILCAGIQDRWPSLSSTQESIKRSNRAMETIPER